jgi:hypothetical protein
VWEGLNLEEFVWSTEVEEKWRSWVEKEMEEIEE